MWSRSAIGIATCALGALTACGKGKQSDVPALDSWQGNAQFELQHEGQKGLIDVAKRGDVVRMEAPTWPSLFGSYGGAEGPRHFLYQVKERTVALVVEQPKLALEFDLNPLFNKALQLPPEPPAEFTLKATGGRGKVAGYTCELWAGRVDGADVEACIGGAGSELLKLGEVLLPPSQAWAKVWFERGQLPLRVHAQRDGVVLFSFELKALDSSAPRGTFEVPTEYERGNFVQALRKLYADREKARQQEQAPPSPPPPPESATP